MVFLGGGNEGMEEWAGVKGGRNGWVSGQLRGDEPKRTEEHGLSVWVNTQHPARLVTPPKDGWISASPRYQPE